MRRKWSDRGDSNSRPPRPERGTLPTALLSECKACFSFAMQRYEKKLKCTLFCGKKYGGSLKNVLFLRKSKKNRENVWWNEKIVVPLQPQTRNKPRKHENLDGAIAQLVEQRTENPCVPGSIPGGTTKRKWWVEPVSCIICACGFFYCG